MAENPRSQDRRRKSSRNSANQASKSRPNQGSSDNQKRGPGDKQHRRDRRQQRGPDRNELWLFGLHAVGAALRNQRRTCHRLVATEDALKTLGDAARRSNLSVTPSSPDAINKLVPRGAVHQGVALHCAPLPKVQLERLIVVQPEQSLLLMLDQITDPRNFGAILRSAVAFGVNAVVVPERRSAELNGTLAKAASGALDMIPICEVTNLSRALEQLSAAGFRTTALDGSAALALGGVSTAARRVLVVGSEGHGVRRLVAEHCDEAAKIDIRARIESLNVSVAAGIALYAIKNM